MLKKLQSLNLKVDGAKNLEVVQNENLTRGFTFETDPGIESLLVLTKDDKVYEIIGETTEVEGKLKHELLLTKLNLSEMGIFQAQIKLIAGEEVRSTKVFSLYISRDISLGGYVAGHPVIDWKEVKEAAKTITLLRREVDDEITKLRSEEFRESIRGPEGPRGYSAYDLWIQDGNEGTVRDFLNSLRGAGDETYIHDQIEAKNIWSITHYLNKFPSVTVVDSGGNVVVGNIRYIDNDRLEIKFSAEFSGKAYLN